ncbi:MAG TPA: cysteine desulfurase NifS [Verrucomicrobiota bacterium]|nr:cysteine desulfurase NifS [Verrucomicrobiota bacterium]HNU51926.1 cysteine desulfurase NifS [Verrucomicrobiota bacterium]
MSGSRTCYFDNNATTPVAPEVVDAMLPFLTERWGNPSSAYRFGSEVGAHLDAAREKVAALIGAEPREVVFTSCGTESNNAAWASALHVTSKRHIVTTAVEHSANTSHAEVLRKRGFDVTLLPVGSDGTLDLQSLEQALRPDTALVSVMWANNETGVLFPVAEVAALCRSKGVLCHTDAVQVPGKLPIDVRALGVDMLSLSGHKLNAPKGIGLLYIKRRTRFQPFVVGGHQEKGRRAGTENVPYIVGFGRAAELALSHLAEENTRVRALRDRVETTLLESVPHTTLNGAREPRLPNTTNLAFDFIEAEAVLMLLDRAGICASSGSACTTGSLDPSHVLSAMGLSPMRARGSLRFSLGRYNTDADVDHLLAHLPGIISRLRAISPLNPQHPDNDRYDVAAARARHEQGMAQAPGD